MLMMRVVLILSLAVSNSYPAAEKYQPSSNEPYEKLPGLGNSGFYAADISSDGNSIIFVGEKTTLVLSKQNGTWSVKTHNLKLSMGFPTFGGSYLAVPSVSATAGRLISIPNKNTIETYTYDKQSQQWHQNPDLRITDGTIEDARISGDGQHLIVLTTNHILLVLDYNKQSNTWSPSHITELLKASSPQWKPSKEKKEKAKIDFRLRTISFDGSCIAYLISFNEHQTFDYIITLDNNTHTISDISGGLHDYFFGQNVLNVGIDRNNNYAIVTDKIVGNRWKMHLYKKNNDLIWKLLYTFPDTHHNGGKAVFNGDADQIFSASYVYSPTTPSIDVYLDSKQEQNKLEPWHQVTSFLIPLLTGPGYSLNVFAAENCVMVWYGRDAYVIPFDAAQKKAAAAKDQKTAAQSVTTSTAAHK